MKNTLRIGKFLISTGVNGPGKRFVIWFQGCPLRCKGCFNPEFWDEKGGILMSIDDIMECINRAKEIEGVTFTGGEPLMQVKPLLELTKRIKEKGLTILCYTGYTYEEIMNERVPGAKELLKWFDILIDGPYKEEEKAPLLWRGSKNQKVYFLTERYKYLEPLVLREGLREVELRISTGEITMTGIFDTILWEKLIKKINRKEK